MDHHWFHLYAVKDRITGIDLPNDSPVADIEHLPLHTFLPSAQDCNSLQSEFGTLIARVITDRITYLHPCKNVVTLHIPHRYSNEMKQKSDVVGNFRCFLLYTWIGIQIYIVLFTAGSSRCSNQIRTKRRRHD